MRKFFVAVCLFVFGGMVSAQGDPQFSWPTPLNTGQMPTNAPLLPALNIMPTLPLSETLAPGTLFFNIEDFSDGYSIKNTTLDSRLHAYNISYQYGIHPVSPNGQYGIYTVPTGTADVITCGILDLLTGNTVDRFDTTGGCHKSSVHWSPDSSRILFQTRDETGLSALGVRQNGETVLFRPLPISEVDLAGASLIDSRDYFASGWLSNEIVTFELGIRGSLSEQLFTLLGDLTVAYPVTELPTEQLERLYILSLPAQGFGDINRGYWITDLETDSSVPLAPTDSVARLAVPSPDESMIVYWAETVAIFGTTHPLRLVIYTPETDTHTVLLQFDGPSNDFPVTLPGELAWNPEGIYFYVAQQPGALSPLQTGTYRIQSDGSNLELVTPRLLWDSLAP